MLHLGDFDAIVAGGLGLIKSVRVGAMINLPVLS
jgi:hypothetical protein